jgi:hypothetical protein
MCAKKEPREVYQPVADLDADYPRMIRGVTLGLDGRGRTSGAWVGAVVFYGLLENV